MLQSVRFAIVGMQSSGSWVYTLENCFCKIFAFSSSLNLRESRSFTSASNGDTPHFVFNFLRVCAQNAFGFLLDCNAIPFSNNLFALRRDDLALFLAFVYFCLAASLSLPTRVLFHARYALVLLRIALRVFTSIGKLPLIFQEGVLDSTPLGTNFCTNSVNLPFKLSHFSSTDVSSFSSI